MIDDLMSTYDKIDRLADEINATDDSLRVLQSAYDTLVLTKPDSEWHNKALKLSADIHKCQDTLRDLVDKRDALIDLLFE